MIRRVCNSTSYFKHLRIWPHCCKGVTDEQGSVEGTPARVDFFALLRTKAAESERVPEGFEALCEKERTRQNFAPS